MPRYSAITAKRPREIVLLRGSGCAYRRCAFCDYHLDCSPVEDANAALNREVLSHVTGTYGELEVINSGSVFELPESTLDLIADTCRVRGISTVHFEAHYLYRDRIPALRERFAADGVALKLKLGLETFDFAYREHVLRKGIPDEDPAVIARHFDEANLLVGLPGQTVSSMGRDIELGLAHFERVCVNVMCPNTAPQYLDVLSRYGAKATFFNLGTQLEGGPEYTDLAKRCADEGHQVASHTYSHDDITLTGMSVEARNEEISKTFTLVSNATGVLTEVMRPPFGEFRGKGYLEYLESGQNISYSAYWTVDSLDWDVASKMGLDDGASQIVTNCTQGLSGDNYNGAIILMHDGGGDRSRDVLALPRIIETFQSAGYEFVTLNEMLASDPAFPSWVTTGYVERPAGSYVPDASLATPVALQA